MRGFLFGLIIGAGAVLAALHYYTYFDLYEVFGGAEEVELVTFENPNTACNSAEEDCTGKWERLEASEADDEE